MPLYLQIFFRGSSALPGLELENEKFVASIWLEAIQDPGRTVV